MKHIQLGIWILIVLVVGCSARRKTIVYSERNFDKLKNEKHIVVEHISGKVELFYRIEVVKYDDKFIYAKCWRSSDSEEENLKFSRTEFIIKRSEDWHGSKAMTAVYSIVLTAAVIALLYLIDRTL